MCNGDLARRANFEIQEHGGIYALSKAIGINTGVIFRVAKGGNSPTLRRLWGIPKHPPRSRLIMNCPPELKARFEKARTNRSRAEFLDELLSLAEGELPY